MQIMSRSIPLADGARIPLADIAVSMLRAATLAVDADQAKPRMITGTVGAHDVVPDADSSSAIAGIARTQLSVSVPRFPEPVQCT